MDDIALESAVEDVIGQFSDPLALFRELIQNAIDAGTAEVEVSADYDEERGLGVVTVADWGEGMTREIIESELVRLFNSAKDADLTKIGKFGIGFVSVFAVKPALVTVETGRDGEYWRMLLHPDRRYDLVELDHPVEGTTVRLFIRQSGEEFARFRRDAVARVRSWCRFVSVPVRFDGDDVREPFDLDGLVVSHFEEEGTRIVAALRERSDCSGEYFNGGLALQQSQSRWPHVEYMIDSRYLEHTLARDRVIEDKNFHAALERLEETIDESLRAETISALRDWPSDVDRYWDWMKICRVALTAWDEAVWREARFPRLRGEPVDVRAVKKARSNNRLMLTRGRASFVHLMPDDYLLLDVRPEGGPADLLAELMKRDIPVLEDVWVRVPLVTIDVEPAAAAFATELEAVLRKMGSAPRVIEFGEFDYPYSGLEELIAVGLEDRRVPTHRADVRQFDPLASTSELLLNWSHSVIRDALRKSTDEPEWAAYTVAKILALESEAIEQDRYEQALDAAVALGCLERRQRRVATR